MFFALIFFPCPWLNWAQSGMVWEVFSLCIDQLADKVVLDHFKLIPSPAVEELGTWICTGGYGRLRGKWVINKNLIFSIFFKEERVCGLMTSLSSQLKNLESWELLSVCWTIGLHSRLGNFLYCKSEIDCFGRNCC